MYVTKLTVYFSIIMRGSMTLWGQRATLSFLQKKSKVNFFKFCYLFVRMLEVYKITIQEQNVGPKTSL